MLHAATIAYEFSGNLTGMNPGSNIFPEVSIGTQVSGIFTVDYDAIDTSASPTFGNFSSQGISLTAAIGGNHFSSLASAVDRISVDSALEDFVVFWLSPEPSGTLSELIFTFYDPTGASLNSDSLPASREDFEAFPSVDLYIVSKDGGAFGHYAFDPTITQIPEPTQSAMVVPS